MKAFTTILIVLLLAGGAVYFYVFIHKPMAVDYARMESGISDLDRAKAELKKFRERTAWLIPAVDTLRSSLHEEIEAGKAEVVAAEDRIVVNIAEQLIYAPRSAAFARGSGRTLTNLTSVLKNLRDMKGKEILIGNVTRPVKAGRRGGRRTAPSKAIDIAADRSVALVTYLIKKGVPEESLGAVAYPAKAPGSGFSIKDRKVMIIITFPFTPAPKPTVPKTKPAPAPVSKPRPEEKPPRETKKPAHAPPTEAPPEKPKLIPIQPAPEE